MEDPNPKARAETNQSELLDFLPRMTIFPGENKGNFEDMRQALMLDLNPATPYETTIADNRISLEWELIRHRDIRDSLVNLEYRKVLTNLVATKSLNFQHAWNESDETRPVVESYFNGTPEARNVIVEHFDSLGISENQILAKAYEQSMSSIADHERKIQGVENRRRKLLEDYNRLKSSRAQPIEDAVVLGVE